jgi:hypothetical protein
MQSEPELSRMTSGIAAHCDPDFRGDLGAKGDAYHLPELVMSYRAAKFISAMFASCLAGMPFATVSWGAAPAAEECLAGPQQHTPPGRHWYFRIDHAAKRHCWYLGEEHAKPAQPVASTSSQPATPDVPNAPDVPKAEEAMQPSIANARAELTAPPTVEQPTRDDTPAPATATNAAIAESAMPTTKAPQWVVASRWPDQSDASPSEASPPAQAVPDEPASTTSASPVSDPPPPPIPVGNQVAAAAPSSETPAYSVPKQLAALIGALAIAGIIGAFAFRFGRARRSDLSRVFDETEDRNERIENFFAQMSRRTSS